MVFPFSFIGKLNIKKMFAFETSNGIDGVIKLQKYEIRCFKANIFLFQKYQERTVNVHCFLEANHIWQFENKYLECAKKCIFLLQREIH